MLTGDGATAAKVVTKQCAALGPRYKFRFVCVENTSD